MKKGFNNVTQVIPVGVLQDPVQSLAPYLSKASTSYSHGKGNSQTQFPVEHGHLNTWYPSELYCTSTLYLYTCDGNFTVLNSATHHLENSTR